jgi:hypothetical protein
MKIKINIYFARCSSSYFIEMSRTAAVSNTDCYEILIIQGVPVTVINKNSIERLSVEIAARYGNCQICPLKLLHFEAYIEANF